MHTSGFVSIIYLLDLCVESTIDNLCGRIRDDKFSDATYELEGTIRETKSILISFLVSQFSGTKIFLVGENVRTEKNSLRVEMVQLK